MLDEIFRTKTRAISNLSSDDILSVLGLQRRHTPFESAVPTSIAFVAGLAAGAGIALLLAPKSGREVRQDISNRANELTSRIGNAASELASEARNALSSSSSSPSSSTTTTGDRAEPTRSLAGTNRTS
jgi:hypothetical protein